MENHPALDPPLAGTWEAGGWAGRGIVSDGAFALSVSGPSLGEGLHTLREAGCDSRHSPSMGGMGVPPPARMKPWKWTGATGRVRRLW